MGIEDELAKVTKLETLSIYRISLAGSGLEWVKSLKSLNQLSVGEVELRGPELSVLAELPKLMHAQDYDATSLRRLLPGFEFKTAIDTLEIISAKTEDKRMYDQREKAQRDYEWALSGARQEGREEGELLGLMKGKLAGKIQMLQELLEDVPRTDGELQSHGVDALTTQLAELQQRLRDRQA